LIVFRHFVHRFFLGILLLLAGTASAQQRDDLCRLARQAGIIFSGVVEGVEHRPPAAPGDVGLVRVTFRVSQALRGAAPGALLTINEWDSLWTAGDRYRAGENLLLLLYPPSGELGLTTTVAGERGRMRAGDAPIPLADLACEPARPPVADDPTPLPPGNPRRFLPRKPRPYRRALE
jgi:hypothetical protein